MTPQLSRYKLVSQTSSFFVEVCEIFCAAARSLTADRVAPGAEGVIKTNNSQSLVGMVHG